MVPTAMSRVNTTRKPVIRSQPNGDCRIHHREYLRDISAGAGTPSAFNVTSDAINPGLPASFPWLSQVAQRFERYKFAKLHYIYETEAPTTLGGTLVLAIDYDASDPSPSSKQQAMAYKNSVRSAPWNECTHSSAREDLSQQKQYFVRSDAVPANADVKLYDTGNLFVISQGVTTASAVLGELYVEYEIMLHTPALNNFALVGGQVGSGGVLSNGAPLGNAPLLDAQSVGIGIDANSVLTFQATGDYLVTLYLAATTITGLTGTLGSGLTALPNGGLVIAAGAATAMLFQTIRVSSLTNATIDFGAIAVAYGNSVLTVAEAPVNSLN